MTRNTDTTKHRRVININFIPECFMWFMGNLGRARLYAADNDSWSCPSLYSPETLGQIRLSLLIGSGISCDFIIFVLFVLALLLHGSSILHSIPKDKEIPVGWKFSRLTDFSWWFLKLKHFFHYIRAESSDLTFIPSDASLYTVLLMFSLHWFSCN